MDYRYFNDWDLTNNSVGSLDREDVWTPLNYIRRLPNPDGGYLATHWGPFVENHPKQTRDQAATAAVLNTYSRWFHYYAPEIRQNLSIDKDGQAVWKSGNFTTALRLSEKKQEVTITLGPKWEIKMYTDHLGRLHMPSRTKTRRTRTIKPTDMLAWVYGGAAARDFMTKQLVIGRVTEVADPNEFDESRTKEIITTDHVAHDLKGTQWPTYAEVNLTLVKRKFLGAHMVETMRFFEDTRLQPMRHWVAEDLSKKNRFNELVIACGSASALTASSPDTAYLYQCLATQQGLSGSEWVR